MMIWITPAADLAPFFRQAKREHNVLSFQKAEATTYLAGFLLDNQCVGFCGILITGPRVWYKNDYVLPQFRGQGYYRALFDRRNELCRRMGIRSVSAFCTDASLPTYLRNGAVGHKKRGQTTYITMDL